MKVMLSLVWWLTASPDWEVLEVSPDDGETETAAKQPRQESHLSGSNQTNLVSWVVLISPLTAQLLIKSLGIPPLPTTHQYMLLSSNDHATVCKVSVLQDYQVRSAE